MSAMRRVHDEDWQDRAACRGPEQSRTFFPPTTLERRDEKDERESRAKAICATCSVRKPCLEYAVRINEQHGIWGGLNENERKVLIKRRSA